jgi:hypothetical protein
MVATTIISTAVAGEASFASTAARIGMLPGDTQASQSAFIVGSAMSEAAE